MKIGEALRKIRNDLGLSQAKMCEGIIQRPFYALVESGKSGIGAESLIKILVKHEIDLDYFYNLVADTYIPEHEKLNRDLQLKMEKAVNFKDLEAINYYESKILTSSTNEILKLRAQVTAAYFKDCLNKVDENTKNNIYRKFDRDSWITSPELLRLITNTMPLWDQEALSTLIKHLLRVIKKEKALSELMLERYIRILGNYLVTCYDRNCYKQYMLLIQQIINYIIEMTNSFHFMIYRFHAYYMYALFRKDKEKIRSIRATLEEYSYSYITASWPEIKM